MNPWPVSPCHPCIPKKHCKNPKDFFQDRPYWHTAGWMPDGRWYAKCCLGHLVEGHKARA